MLGWLGDEADATNIYDDDDESSPSALLPPKHFLTPFLALPGGHGTESVPKRDFYVCVPEEDYISTLGKESSNTDKRIVYVDWPQSQAAHRICMKITY